MWKDFVRRLQREDQKLLGYIVLEPLRREPEPIISTSVQEFVNFVTTLGRAFGIYGKSAHILSATDEISNANIIFQLLSGLASRE